MRLTNDGSNEKTENGNDTTKNDGRLSWWYWRRPADKSQSKTMLKEDSPDKTVITIDTSDSSAKAEPEDNQAPNDVSIDIPGKYGLYLYFILRHFGIYHINIIANN